LVIALTSGDIARLARTWAGVPKEELAALAELERLVGPVGNFGRLRREMEGPTLALASSGQNLGGGSGVGMSGGGMGRTLAEEEQGTIPFVGVYTHDLIYNAQKPPYLPSSTRIDGTSGNAAHGREGCSGEGLVNFERHHRAAGIVKNLLRLLESSGRYVVEMDREPAGTTTTPDRKGMLRVVPEALARCLWLGALTDREIAQLSRRIEPYVINQRLNGVNYHRVRRTVASHVMEHGTPDPVPGCISKDSEAVSGQFGRHGGDSFRAVQREGERAKPLRRGKAQGSRVWCVSESAGTPNQAWAGADDLESLEMMGERRGGPRFTT
ncbi:MAG: hypothetical protein Q9157_007646, partial [Trypethelium eluteriae]